MDLSREYINAGLSKQFQWGVGVDPIAAGVLVAKVP